MSTTKHRRPLSGLLALVVALVWLPLLATASRAADPVLVPDPTINGCNGVLPTPGSENTTKRLDPAFPSDFNPGGIIGYVIDFPVDAADVGGDFEITDCVYVDPPGGAQDAPIAKYFVHFVPNNTSFQLRFSVPIPDDTPLGSQFCNYAKTTASPSASQASNRKAGPACFTVGGGLRIEKRSGSASGPLLGGASFSVVCTPTTSQPPTIITGLSNQSTSGPGGTVVASGSSATGTIAINGPSGTPCVVTETAAPDGYVLDPAPRALVIPVGTSQTVNVFVNQQLGSLSVSKHAVGGSGTFHFTVTCDDGETYPGFDMTVAAGDTETHLVSDDVVVGTHCTVAETANALFSTVRSPANGTVTVDADGETVAFTNTRLTGALVVQKASDVDGTFSFDVDCTDDAFDTTLTITTSGHSGSDRVENIPTGTSCTVTEQSNPLFSSVVSPQGGTVVIATGDNTVTFTNTRLTGSLVIAKAADVDGTFTFDVDCSDDAFDASNVSITTTGHAGSHTISGIPTGVTCTVTEDADPAHWTTVVSPSGGTVTIGTGGNTVSFENTRVRGDLVVTKSADVDGTFSFVVDCSDDQYDVLDLQLTTVSGTATYTLSDVPTGVTCVVTEHADSRYTTEVLPANGTVTIDDDGETVAFTNTRKRGSLVVTKQIVDATNSGPHAFTYHVTCNGAALDDFQLGDTAGLTKTIEGIPTGDVCTVTEDADATWAKTVTPESGTVTISDTPATVAFVNTKLYTATSLAKTADPASGSAVTDGATITYTLAYANAGNIPATVTITDEIPDGTTYVADSSGGGVLADGELSWTVEVPAGGSGTVSFQVTVDTGLDDPFTIRNVAVLHEGEEETPTNETEHPVAHVGITKAVDKGTAAYGDALTYTLTVNNPGAAALTGVTVADDVPEGVEFVSASDGGVLDNGVVTWAGRDLAAGASFSVTWVARITRPAAAADGAIASRVILNTAVVATDQTGPAASNRVRTVVRAVLGVKRVKPPVKPPTLPTTGAPLTEAVWLSVALLLAGAGLTFGSTWRAALAKAREE
ncbi:MAG TPA: DUF5979 domain-containing protein [Mycobacteriales bacterium]|jgi:uncharacterized repeat protein (TIGR01451 family)